MLHAKYGYSYNPGHASYNSGKWLSDTYECFELVKCERSWSQETMYGWLKRHKRKKYMRFESKMYFDLEFKTKDYLCKKKKCTLLFLLPYLFAVKQRPKFGNSRWNIVTYKNISSNNFAVSCFFFCFTEKGLEKIFWKMYKS